MGHYRCATRPCFIANAAHGNGGEKKRMWQWRRPRICNPTTDDDVILIEAGWETEGGCIEEHIGRNDADWCDIATLPGASSSSSSSHKMNKKNKQILARFQNEKGIRFRLNLFEKKKDEKENWIYSIEAVGLLFSIKVRRKKRKELSRSKSRALFIYIITTSILLLAGTK